MQYLVAFLHQSVLVYLCVFFVYRLKPFTSYKFRMLATNDVGDSVLSKETEAVTTLQDGERLGTLGRKDKEICGFENITEMDISHLSACMCFSSSFSFSVFFPVPNEPPVILAVKPTTTTSVLVQWKVFADSLIQQWSLRFTYSIYTQAYTTKLWVQVNQLFVEWDSCRLIVCSICAACVCGCNYHYLFNQERSEGSTDRLVGCQEGETDRRRYRLSWPEERNVQTLTSRRDVRGREKQTLAMSNNRGKKKDGFRATVTCEKTVNTAWLLHCMSIFLFGSVFSHYF